MNNDESLIGNDGELRVAEKFTDPKMLPFLPDLYLADPANVELIDHKTQDRNWTGLMTLSGIITVILTVIAVALTAIFVSVTQDWDTALLASGLLWGLLALIVLLLWIVNRVSELKEERFYERGRLIIGHITRYKRRSEATDLIDYEFVTPKGRTLTVHDHINDRRRDSMLGEDAQDTSIPDTGTPVAVLYLNDNNFKLL